MATIISFDLDDTLSDKIFDTIVWFNAIPQAYAIEKHVPFPQAQHIVLREYYALKGHARWTDPVFWLKHFKLKTTWNDILLQTRQSIRHFPEVKPVLARLKKQHKLIIMTASTHAMAKAKLSAEGLGDYFSEVYSAPDDFGSSKKDAAVYEKLLKKLHCKPEDIFHVGDHWEYDFVVPTRLGMRAILIDRSGMIQGSIKSLKELQKLV